MSETSWNMSDPPSYRDLQTVAEAEFLDVSAAEWHGSMTGMLCANIDATYERWVDVMRASAEGLPFAAEDSRLRSLFHATRDDLAESDFSFAPLLPDDDEPLSVRARALGGWCQGFLYGLGQFASDWTWSADSDEVLRDFAEISRLENSDGNDADEEADYVEIAEFVRVGVQLIRCECEKPRHTRIH